MTLSGAGYPADMGEGLVLVLWLVTAAGGLTILLTATRPWEGWFPAHLGAPGGLVALHAIIAVAGLAAWTALVLTTSDEAEPSWLLPALAAVVAAGLGATIYWRAHHTEAAERTRADQAGGPALERPPALLRYAHGALGLATAVAALVVALA